MPPPADPGRGSRLGALVVLALIVASLAWYFVAAWGAGYIFTKAGLQYAPPFTFLALRFGFGLLCLLPVLLLTLIPASGPTVEDVVGLRRPLTQSRQRNVERYVELQATDVIFHLDAVFLDGAVVAAGDSLVDGESVTYQVVFVELQTLNNIVVAIGRPVP